MIGRRAAGFPASLYVHLPFCSRKCAYCDFFSVPGADAGTIEKTLDSELRELDFLLETYSPRPVPTLYVGGGTPSFVPRDILGSFLRRLVARLPSAPGEFTVEANPESLDEDLANRRPPSIDLNEILSNLPETDSELKEMINGLI